MRLIMPENMLMPSQEGRKLIKFFSRRKFSGVMGWKKVSPEIESLIKKINQKAFDTRYVDSEPVCCIARD